MSNFNQTIKTIEIFSADSNSIGPLSVKVIREVALRVNLNGKPLANIACAGNYLDELAVGFLKSEKIITGLDEIEKIDVETPENSVNIILKNKKTSSETVVKNIASSGARGKGVDADLFLPLKVPVEFNIKAKVALELMEELLEKSLLHNETHGTHCSALAEQEKIVALREDIGRHNTIDMLGGYSIMQGKDLSEAIILTTGRISSEIVYKVWNLGIPAIISHSAPTTKAIELLQKANITLIGYVRNSRMNIYSQERRVII